MKEVLLMMLGGVITLAFEYLILIPLLKRRKYTAHESAVLQSMAFLECKRTGDGAAATLTIGHDVFEDWEHLAAFEKLLSEGMIVREGRAHSYCLSANAQKIAVRLFERGARTPYIVTVEQRTPEDQ